ncbi:MAG: polyprenyl synthetase family protein [Candidatus Thermoplasmatota archaeon]
MMYEQSVTLETFLRKSLEDIERKISEIINDEKILFNLKGGKRLRPLLASIAFKACTKGEESSDVYERFLEGCVGIELAHGASLIHDDIIDGDRYRRGEPAFYVTAGLDNAILIGHKMLVLGFDMALRHGERFARLYLNAWQGTLDGQLSEVNFNSKELNNGQISADSKFFQIYSRIIDLKTATLFSSGCKAAALWAQSSDSVAEVLGGYGREVGFAYQLADDLVDLTKGEMIDSVVLPLLSRLDKKTIKNGSLRARSIKKKLEKNSPEIQRLYLSEIQKHLAKAQEYCSSSLIPENHYKNFLRQAPSYIINKMLEEINMKI